MSAVANQYYEFGVFRLHPSQRQLLRENEAVALSPKLFDTLLALVQNTGLVVSKDELMSRVWPDTIVEERSLSQNIFLLRKALGEDSNGRNYIETVPKVGYRFLPRVTECEDAPDTLVVERHERVRIISSEEEMFDRDETLTAMVSGRNALRATRREGAALIRPGWATLLALVMLPTLASITGYLALASKTGSEPKVKSIAVLPFKPLGADIGDEYLGLGMADTLIAKLGNVNRIIVRPTSAIRKYAGEEQDALVAGREQRVEAVLEGSIQRSGDRIRLSVHLVSVRDGAPLWSYKCDERCTDIFALQDSVSEKVAEALTVKLSGEEKRLLAKHSTDNTEAHQLYLKGRYFWNKRTSEGFQKAFGYFNQAVEKDSNYALAYAGLADSYTMLANYDLIAPKDASLSARMAATRALEIDDSLAEAHTSLADIKRFFDWDWAGAEQEYKRAIELNPNYSTAHQWYAEFLSAMGRHDEAIREMTRAEELDPLSLVVKSAAGWILLFAREYDRAIAECERVIEMDSDYGEVYSQLRRAFEQKGMYGEAFAANEKLKTFRSKPATNKQPSLNSAQSAKAHWQRMLETAGNGSKNRDAMRMAEIFAQLGQKDRAFEWLEQVYEERSFWLPFLRVHPHLDPVRSDPRFKDILRRVHLEDERAL